MRPADAFAFAVDAARAAALVAARFPELAGLPVRPFGDGVDNAAFEVGGRWVFRFPRRPAAVPFLEAELAALPLLRGRLPVAVPQPRYVAPPGPDYPAPCAGYERLEGVTACRVPLDDRARGALGPALGGFLRALHALDVRPALDPGVGLGRSDVPRRRASAEARLQPLVGGPLDAAARQGLALLDAAAAAAAAAERAGSARATVTVHGDLYARHLLLGARNELLGVIDWGDVHAGDPALDLAIAHSILPVAAHGEFLAAYGDVDVDTWARARFRAVQHGAHVLALGVERADLALAQVALTALRFLSDA